GTSGAVERLPPRLAEGGVSAVGGTLARGDLRGRRVPDRSLAALVRGARPRPLPGLPRAAVAQPFALSLLSGDAGGIGLRGFARDARARPRAGDRDAADRRDRAPRRDTG